MIIPGSWQLIAAGVVVVAVGGYVLHCEHVKKDRAAFISKLEAQAEAQRKEVQRITKENVSRKEKADADHKRTTDSLRADLKRLRERPGAGTVPAAPSGSGRPDLACFDRAEYQRAYRDLVAEVRGLSDEGSTCTVDLNTGKGWANDPR